MANDVVEWAVAASLCRGAPLESRRQSAMATAIRSTKLDVIPKPSLPLPRAPLPQGEGRVRAILLSRISPTALFTSRGSTNSVNKAVPILRWCEQKAGGQSRLTFG